ncbi:MAG: hypothetical protein ACRECV_12430 [Xanthobacteraceae bacterium]
MSTLKTIALAAALGLGAISVAMAQNGSPAFNARHSGGAGTHSTAVKTGSSANTQKVIKNQNGYHPR